MSSPANPQTGFERAWPGYRGPHGAGSQSPCKRCRNLNEGLSVRVRTDDLGPRSGKSSRRERRIIAQDGVRAKGEGGILGKPGN